MSHERIGKPVSDRYKSQESGYEIQGQNSKIAQIRALFDRPREQIITAWEAGNRRHKFQADYDPGSIQTFIKMKRSSRQLEEFIALKQKDDFDKIINFFMNSFRNKWDLREAHEKSQRNGRIEEVSEFYHRHFFEREVSSGSRYFLGFTGKIQELRNEINCMNDSKEFQDSESVRSGRSHVTSRPMSFPLHPILEGMLRHSFVSPRRNVFEDLLALSTALSAGIESMEFVRGAAPSVHSGENRKARTKSGPEMPAWTASQKFGLLQWRRLLKELWGRPTTTPDFGSSFRQIPYTSDVCLLEISCKTEVCTCSQFPTETMQWIKEVEMVDSVDDLKFSSSTRGIRMPNNEVLVARHQH